MTTLKISAGAGGSEPQIFAQRLLTMYLRWAAHHGLPIKPGRDIERTEDGIRGATIEIDGDASDLRSETGVHRFVRLPSGDERRHTSFVLVSVDGAESEGQIRSYVFNPYRKAKDLRTGHEREDVDEVLAGDIDDFLRLAKAYGLPRDPRDFSCAVPD